MEALDLEYARKLWLTDKKWSVYALADLQDPQFLPDCKWYVSKPGEEDAVVLVFSAFDVPVIIAQGSVQTVGRILDDLELPPRLFAMVQDKHHALLMKRYSYDQGIDPMVRMVLDAEPSMGSKPSDDESSLKRLRVQDEAEVRKLFSYGGAYAPGEFFSAYQIEQGVFYGVYSKEDELIAVGGTHVVDRTHGTAAIGNMYTHPQQRKKGLATRILHAIITDLQADNIDTIVLNVNQQNQVARDIYETFGFRFHCNYVEGMGTLKEI